MESRSDFVKVNVSNSKNDSIAFEVKFVKSITIEELKRKLEIITGGCADTMQLQLFNGSQLLTDIKDNAKPLGFYGPENGMRLHVIDDFLRITEESVEKFELTDNQYDTKRDTLRHFLKSNKLGKYNDEEMEKLEQKRLEQEQEEKRHAELCTIGSRCQVTVAGQPTRRGTIMYNGPLDGKKGTYIGVKYDEPLGKNNGSIKGKVYFVCEPNYGGFVLPTAVEVGDFPEETFDLDDEL